MAKFMDVHNGLVGVTEHQLREARGCDLAVEAAEGVHFEHAWLDPGVRNGVLPVVRAVERNRTPGARPGRAPRGANLRAVGRGRVAAPGGTARNSTHWP